MRRVDERFVTVMVVESKMLHLYALSQWPMKGIKSGVSKYTRPLPASRFDIVDGEVAKPPCLYNRPPNPSPHLLNVPCTPGCHAAVDNKIKTRSYRDVVKAIIYCHSFRIGSCSLRVYDPP
jgi:hypothetical protein